MQRGFPRVDLRIFLKPKAGISKGWEHVNKNVRYIFQLSWVSAAVLTLLCLLLISFSKRNHFVENLIFVSLSFFNDICPAFGNIKLTSFAQKSFYKWLSRDLDLFGKNELCWHWHLFSHYSSQVFVLWYLLLCSFIEIYFWNLFS